MVAPKHPRQSVAQPPPKPATICISYSTGWSRAFLHFNVDGKGSSAQHEHAYHMCFRNEKASPPSGSVASVSGLSQGACAANLPTAFAGWTAVPGVPMHSQGYGQPNTMVVEGSRIEFVVNNGENGW